MMRVTGQRSRLDCPSVRLGITCLHNRPATESLRWRPASPPLLGDCCQQRLRSSTQPVHRYGRSSHALEEDSVRHRTVSGPPGVLLRVHASTQILGVVERGSRVRRHYLEGQGCRALASAPPRTHREGRTNCRSGDVESFCSCKRCRSPAHCLPAESRRTTAQYRT